jgi:hypothetical protein
VPEPEHTISLAVWDLSSPVVIGRRATLKVGIACSSGCDLSGTVVDIYNEAGARVGAATLGSAPWGATTALYWAELGVTSPEAEGDHAWSIHAKTLLAAHGDATSTVHFIACKPPEHRVTLHVIDKNSGVPLARVELRLGRFRAATDAAGVAHVDVPAGMYDVGTWKNGYEVVSKTVDIGGDTTIRLELSAAPEPEQPYWM